LLRRGAEHGDHTAWRRLANAAPQAKFRDGKGASTMIRQPAAAAPTARIRAATARAGPEREDARSPRPSDGAATVDLRENAHIVCIR
jgi:hypothetical protein